MINILYTTSPIEFTFFIVSIIIAFISIFSLKEAVVDQAFLLAMKVNGPRKLVADTNIRAEAVRLVQCMIMLLTSMGSLFLAPPPPDYKALPQSMLFLFAWILTGGTMILSSLLERAARKKLQQYSPIEMQSSTVSVSPPISGETKTQVEVRIQDARVAIDKDGLEEKQKTADNTHRISELESQGNQAQADSNTKRISELESQGNQAQADSNTKRLDFLESHPITTNLPTSKSPSQSTPEPRVDLAIKVSTEQTARATKETAGTLKEMQAEQTKLNTETTDTLKEIKEETAPAKPKDTIGGNEK